MIKQQLRELKEKYWNFGLLKFAVPFASVAVASIIPSNVDSSISPAKIEEKIAQAIIPTEKQELVIDKDYKFKPVVEQLLERGADTAFIKDLIADESIQFDSKLIKMNVMNYIPKSVPKNTTSKKLHPVRASHPSSYSHNYNAQGVAATEKFIQENLEDLTKAEKTFGVPKEVIASLMWVETKHGKNTGTYTLPEVFMTIAMANQPEILKSNLQNMGYKPGTAAYNAIYPRMKYRADKKAEWALNELIALEEMEKNSRYSVAELKGSFAGAFGLCQFLPSSYVAWAKDGSGDGKIDLYDKRDAMFSVANYLKTNGWQQSKIAAVYHYNNSGDYVNAVLTLAEKVRG